MTKARDAALAKSNNGQREARTPKARVRLPSNELSPLRRLDAANCEMEVMPLRVLDAQGDTTNIATSLH